MTPPWDCPAWVLIRLKEAISNASLISDFNPVLDLSCNLLEKAFLADQERFIKTGISGIAAAEPHKGLRTELYPESFLTLLSPPFRSGCLAEIPGTNLMPVIGRTSEAIIVSNVAQAADQTIRVMVLLRSTDFAADASSTGPISILELLPQLPNLQMAGFFLGFAFSRDRELEKLSRAISRLPFPDPADLLVVGSNPGRLGEAFKPRKLVGAELFGLGDPQEDCSFSAALSIQAWAYPAGAASGKTVAVVETGLEDGFCREENCRIQIEGFSARMIDCTRKQMHFIMDERPPMPPPWRALLAGIDSFMMVSTAEWKTTNLQTAASILASKLPVFVIPEGS